MTNVTTLLRLLCSSALRPKTAATFPRTKQHFLHLIDFYNPQRCKGGAVEVAA